jgi:ABC-type phosphate/phosphonate transport system ATPase subunit
MNLDIVLTRLQQEAATGLLENLAVNPVVVIQGAEGSGKSTILQALNGLRGGVLLGAQHIPGIRQAHGPAAIEEAFFRMIEDALLGHDLVFVDDLTLVTNAARGGGHGRVHLMDAALTAILAEARALGKRLVFAAENEVPWPIRRRAVIVRVGE